MTINSSVSEAAKNSVAIESFIFHIIESGEEEPLYNDQVVLDTPQKEFFEERIREACDGTQFVFRNPEVEIKEDCSALVEGSEGSLVRYSRRLTSRFLIAHNNSMNNGVFIVSVFSMAIGESRKKFVCLMKVDYSTVYEQRRALRNGKQVVSLTRVINSLADSPKALQKWAVIDSGDTYSWDVTALQRHKSAADKDTDSAISKYFKKFIESEIKRNASALTKETVSQCRDWARTLINRPDEMPLSGYKARAISYFDANPNFETEPFIEHVIGRYVHEDMEEQRQREMQELREVHKEDLRARLEEVGIAGQVFESRPNSIAPTSKKNTIKTMSGLTVEYSGERKDHNLNVVRVGNEYVITIKTTSLDENL